MSDFNWFELLIGVILGLMLIGMVELLQKIRINNATGVTQKWIRLCKTCKHPKSTHNGFSGPYSSGKYNHGECTQDSRSFPPYRSGGCDCYEFKKSILPRRYHARS